LLFNAKTCAMARDVTAGYVALKAILLLLAVLECLFGFVLLFGAVPLAGLLPATLHLLPAIAVMVLMAFGVLALGFGYLSYLASRNPVRYVGIIDVLVFLLVAGALLGLYLNFALHAPSGPLLWTGAILRIALALVLIALRPKGINSID
jgi:hypothetical protein